MMRSYPVYIDSNNLDLFTKTRVKYRKMLNSSFHCQMNFIPSVNICSFWALFDSKLIRSAFLLYLTKPTVT